MGDAIAFLTTFGRKGGTLRAGAFGWFPLVGAALGALLGGCWWLAGEYWPPFVAAAVIVVLDLACTGMLHFDGLADTADGLLPHAPPARRLEIMRGPEVGAFGVCAVGAALVLRTAALTAEPASVLLIVAVWAAARALVASVPAFVPYARETGIASTLLDGAPWWPVLAVPVAVVVAALGPGLEAAIGVVVGCLAGVAVLIVARRRVGGFTGDVLGAVVVVTETVALVVAAGRV
jgi:adenosylcobinamide-GDP ribazoletransferase